jgi:DNA replication and repair protein RecF
MYLQRVHIKQWRNLLNVELTLSPSINVLIGANGSGKTSFLEAIYYLSRGRSFRTHLFAHLVNHQSENISLFAELWRKARSTPLGIERHRGGDVQIRMDYENLKTILPITELLPVQVLHPDSREVLTKGPKIRRQFMDWGVFHVKPSFYPAWQVAMRALKQRNAALKQQLSNKMIGLWDHELIAAAEQMDILRSDYLGQLTPLFEAQLRAFGLNYEIKLLYRRGWPKEQSLEEALITSIAKDRITGHTQYGPHRADMAVIVGRYSVDDVLSQGQQKLVVYALHLAQGQLLHKLSGKQCIYLFDDVGAELDETKRHLVMEVLNELGAQVFITTVEESMIAPFLISKRDHQMFHVEQGRITLQNSSL